MHRLRIPNEVAALIRATHPLLKKKIKEALQNILLDPSCGKPLKGDLKGLRSFRVSRFRIIYQISRKGQIEVIALGPRARVYEETFLLIRKTMKG